METLLVVVTIVALALAIGMSVLAWRLLRDDRQRAVARSEALRTAALVTEDLDSIDERAPLIVRTRGSSAYNTGEPAAPFRTRATDQRFAALDEAEPQPDSWDVELEPVDQRRPRSQKEGGGPEVVFGATVARTAPTGRWLALTAIAAVMTVCLLAVYVRHLPPLAMGSNVEQATSVALPAGARPLELLSLRHTTDPDGTFTVTGLVQNPYEGQPARRVVAVVYLFDRDGNYFAGSKAALDFTALQPGDESAFVVRVPTVGRVSRYRVGFRSEDGGVIVHVDRRGQLPGGTTGDAVDTQGTPHPAATPTSAPRRSEGRP
jgi:hypothetical protein